MRESPEMAFSIKCFVFIENKLNIHDARWVLAQRENINLILKAWFCCRRTEYNKAKQPNKVL